MSRPAFAAPLRVLLAVDALTCLLTGTVLVLATSPIADLTAIPAALLHGAGLALLPIAAFMAFYTTRGRVPGWALSVIVLGNALWVLASVLLPLTGSIRPNGLGWIFLLGQAAVVAVLAVLESRAGRAATVTV
ncbi:MAG: hypothetical protein AB7G13_27070 [Lautropia sp.]